MTSSRGRAGWAQIDLLYAGLERLQPSPVGFWGDRYGQFRDPLGILWSMGAPIRKG